MKTQSYPEPPEEPGHSFMARTVSSYIANAHTVVHSHLRASSISVQNLDAHTIEGDTL